MNQIDLIKTVEQILFVPALVQHIDNGAARDLYPPHVADNAKQLVVEQAKERTEESK